MKNFAGLLKPVVCIIGTLRSNDADDNENVKKTIGLISKTTTSVSYTHLTLPTSDLV